MPEQAVAIFKGETPGAPPASTYFTSIWVHAEHSENAEFSKSQHKTEQSQVPLVIRNMVLALLSA